jgi:hypothetical protein
MQVLGDQRPSHGHHGRHSRQGRHAALPLPGTAPAAPVAQTGGSRPGHPPSPPRRPGRRRLRPRRGPVRSAARRRTGPVNLDQLRRRHPGPQWGSGRRLPRRRSCTSASNDPRVIGPVPLPAATPRFETGSPSNAPAQKTPRGPPAGGSPRRRCRPGSSSGPEGRPQRFRQPQSAGIGPGACSSTWAKLHSHTATYRLPLRQRHVSPHPPGVEGAGRHPGQVAGRPAECRPLHCGCRHDEPDHREADRSRCRNLYRRSTRSLCRQSYLRTRLPRLGTADRT